MNSPLLTLLLIPLLLLLSLLTSPTCAQKSPSETINNIIVFGDSYSDVGNKQRLTNGPLWSEHLAVGWNASLHSFAFSGAVCNNDMYPEQQLDNEAYIPSIHDQVEMYYNQVKKNKLNLDMNETTIIFWVGVNDVYKIFENNKDADDKILEEEFKKVVDCIGSNVRDVRKVFSATKFIVFGVPPMERMPYYAETPMASSREKAANQLNQLLTKEVEKMNKHLQALELDLVDVHHLIDDIVDKPQLFNLKNAKDPYWDICQGQCEDPIDSYVWWDKTHLTGGIHRLIANSILMAGSLAPEAYLEDDLDVNQVLQDQQPYSTSPIYTAHKMTGEIQREIQRLNQEKAKQDMTDQEGNTDTLDYDGATEAHTGKSTSNNNFFYFAISGTLIVCVGFFILVKTGGIKKRTNLAALSGLINKGDSNRGRFMPLRNMDNEV